MAMFLGREEGQRSIRHARGRRTRRQLLVERLEPRVVLDAGLTPGTAMAVTATAGTLVIAAPLVTFTDGATPLPANDYTATIDWGDGTPTSGGTISVSGTTFTVTGSHNFGQPSSSQPGGVDIVTVEIVGDGQQVSTTTTATVRGLTYAFFESPILPIGLVPFEAVAGSPTGGLGLGPFQGSPPPDPTAYTAVVDWGDGSTAIAATIEAAGSGALDPYTSGHTYAAAGNYAITTTIRDSQGFVVGTGNEPIYVFDPTATPVSLLTATAGSPTGPLTVATVTAQPNYNLEGSYYTAVVDWGDGSQPVDATITTLNADASMLPPAATPTPKVVLTP